MYTEVLPLLLGWPVWAFMYGVVVVWVLVSLMGVVVVS